MSHQNLHFFINTASGGPGTQAKRNALTQAISEKSPIAKVTLFSNTDADIDQRMLAAQSDSELPVFVGGDGTLSRAIYALKLSDQAEPKPINLAYIPLGTGNDAGRSLGLSPDPIKALDAILADTKGHEIDVLRVAKDGETFAYSATLAAFGLPPQVVQKTPKFAFAGAQKYSLATIATIFNFNRAKGTLTTDDGQSLDLSDHWLVGLGCAAYTGGGMKMVPEAMHDDGVAELVALKMTGPIRLITLLIKVFSGAHVHDPNVSITPHKRATVTLPEPQTMVVDGEHMEVSGQLHIDLEPNAVRIYGASVG